MKLSGNTILITGGSAGIGLAFANKFVELGNEVIVTGRSQERLDTVANANPKLQTICSDVADPKAVAGLARTVKDRFPKLNVLMNNAGIMVFMSRWAPEFINGQLAKASKGLIPKERG